MKSLEIETNLLLEFLTQIKKQEKDKKSKKEFKKAIKKVKKSEKIIERREPGFPVNENEMNFFIYNKLSDGTYKVTNLYIKYEQSLSNFYKQKLRNQKLDVILN